MELFYEDTDISRHVDIRKCVFRENAVGRSDALELELENAAAWYGWGPQTDDRIRALHGGFDTGTLYLNTVLPEHGHYRILATSVSSAARRKTWRAFENMTILQLMRANAVECGMNSALFGVEENLKISFLLRRNESGAALLDRLLCWEGAALKAYNGRYIGIGKEQNAEETIRLSPSQRGVEHIRRSGTQYAGLTVKTPYAEATAEDPNAQGNNSLVITDLPAADAVTAGRWARGLLLHNNRKAETLRITDMGYRPKLTAMARVDVDSSADFAGEWIADEVEHDLKNVKTTITLVRCLNGIS